MFLLGKMSSLSILIGKTASLAQALRLNFISFNVFTLIHFVEKYREILRRDSSPPLPPLTRLCKSQNGVIREQGVSTSRHTKKTKNTQDTVGQEKNGMYRLGWGSLLGRSAWNIGGVKLD